MEKVGTNAVWFGPNWRQIYTLVCMIRGSCFTWAIPQVIETLRSDLGYYRLIGQALIGWMRLFVIINVGWCNQFWRTI